MYLMFQILIRVLYILIIVFDKIDADIFISNVNGTNNIIYNPEIYDTSEIVPIKNNVGGQIKSENYPEPYLLTSGFTCNLTVDDGYYIDIIVEDFDLDGAAGDYLSIKSDMEQILTWKIKTPKRFRSANNYFEIDFVVQPRKDPMDENTHRGFSLKWEPSDEMIPTPPPFESTTPDFNNIPDDEIEWSVVYVTADDPEHFLENKIVFEQMLVEMSNKYCEEHEIPLQDDITLNNILMSNMSYCPITWPNYMDCIQIRFAIPVLLNDTAVQQQTDNSTYELSSDHLKEMWNEYKDDMLSTIGLREFPVPNNAIHLELWIGVSVAIVIFFLILLILLWKFDFFEMNAGRPISSYTDAAFDYEEHKTRPSDLSLYPLPHQAIPPLYDAPDELWNEFTNVDMQSNKNNFPLYEPDTLYGNSGSQKDMFYSSPPSYTTEPRDENLKVFEYVNPTFVNDEENIIFQRGHHKQ